MAYNDKNQKYQIYIIIYIKNITKYIEYIIFMKIFLHNFVLYKAITCDDRDPPRINSSIRRLIQDKKEACKRFKRSNNNSQHFRNFQSLQNLLGFPRKFLGIDIILI